MQAAASWGRPRRVIAKVEHHRGELFPRVGFVVTILTGTNRAVIRFCNWRGTAEPWIKEGKVATHWTRLSCHRFRANEVWLLPGVIACNLGGLLRRLALPLAIRSWSLTSLQPRLFKAGGRLIRHARYDILHLAERYLTRSRFRQIIGASSDSCGTRPDPEYRKSSCEDLGGRRGAIMKREDMLQALPSKEDIARAVGLQARASTPGDILTAFGLFGTGMLLGAGLAPLFAPKAGHAIRHDIAEKVGEIREHLRAPTPQSATSANPPSA